MEDNIVSALNSQKKVCIIIPVYNTEKFLGYSLNSVLSQTYTNWTAILVDDGSTDSSLQICRQYMALDNRFQVISIPNSGVSNARNVGLEAASGDYLTFLDSDDILSPDALEKQVIAALQYDKQLIVSDSLMVDFSNPCGSNRIKLHAGWLSETPCVLSHKEFKEKEMQIIWYSALMEGPWAKLYDLKLWKALDLKFPREISLGEDFLTNLKYYDACNGVVFLQEVGYYYNCIVGSNSLTQKYRSDLFENKMYLMTELQKHLGDWDSISAQEQDAFYCYVASTGFSCAEKFAKEAALTKQQKLEHLDIIFSHPLFAECVQKASFIPEQYVPCVPAAKKKKCRSILRYLSNSQLSSTDKRGEKMKVHTLLNTTIRHIMRAIRPIFGKSSMGERIERWEKEFASSGLKNTVKAHSESNKKVTRYQLLMQTQQLEQSILSSEKAINLKLLSIQNDIEKNIKDSIWLSEQRITRNEYLRSINELRQKKKALMLATAEHSNIGDAAITLAEQEILYAQFPEYYQIEISTYEFERKEKFLHSILNPQDIIFIHGGGNLGDMYTTEENLHRKIVSEFPNNKIIIFPQTISFSASVTGYNELAISKAIYNQHHDLTLFVRGEESLAFAKMHFPNVKSFLMPDCTHVLRTCYAFPRDGALFCLRNDCEVWLNEKSKGSLIDIAERYYSSIDHSTNMYDEDILRDIRGFVVRSELMYFSKHRIVVTDRLHGMIFSAVTGTPCIVISSFNHKISEYYNAFFKSSNAVFFIGNNIDQFETAVRQALQVKTPEYPILDDNWITNLRKLSETILP